MEVPTIRPIIIRSDRAPAHEVYEAFNAVRLALMDWWAWYAKVPVLILDPVRLQVPAPEGGWDNHITGRLWHQVDRLITPLYQEAADALLVLMEHHKATDTYGSGLQYWTGEKNFGLAVVDKRVCLALQGEEGAIEIEGWPVSLAVGAIQHEIGHAIGHQHSHSSAPDVMWEWWQYPNVHLEAP